LQDKSTKRYLITYHEDARDGEEGKKYSGQWTFVNGRMVKDGLGVMTWPDGSKYEGQFENDRMSG